MGILEDGMASLAEDMEAFNSETVVYTRGPALAVGAGAIVVVSAVRGRHTHERIALGDGRARLNQEPQDWLIRSAALDYGAGPFEPARGDRIADGFGKVYEVLDRSEEPAFRRSDPYGIVLRVRTVRVT